MPGTIALSYRKYHSHSLHVKVAAKCSIRAMPTFHLYKGGEKIAEMMGADAAKLASLVTQHK